MRILLVCLGNICRSPTAEAILLQHLKRAGLADTVTVDSCGTGPWHVGEPPDPRAQAAAAQRGIDMSDLRARQLAVEDFYRFDYLLAMDHENLAVLQSRRPTDSEAHIGLFLEMGGMKGKAVPDPYFGGSDGFDGVLDLIEAGADGLIQRLQARMEMSR
ncbi:low molecular weight protein-tyrosine-phosphatase [Aidingimonas halophila]|uniref:protein-tyrosine-phosphatase n=1 Tax=Aidingimonas halophila TaxID=574349 RepID=A0A1H2QNY5_9GAMM|nr:low molecular weight protein-tyrosine-phosphatase [Aidingimonas halophila]GHC20465.1 phosphotyrosine protein phosphatase [Aidingimonas halophila]SDW08841.1 protein tyrosine phosphatase [Aidingimonas halophila]